MKYVSTRGRAPRLGFNHVLLGGLASDGGLYVPESWPAVSPETLRGWRGLSYPDLAFGVMAPFVAGAVSRDDLTRIVHDAYGAFDHAAVAPLKQLDRNLWLMELFHGPTLAFKDFGLQILGPLLDHALERRGERAAIVAATSGDTGSAAIEACRDRERMDIFILFPHGRVSDVQRRQMTTVESKNVHCLALDGSFDDCQQAVKTMFADEAFRGAVNLAAVNSINWARIMAQTVYYVWAALRLGAPERKAAFSAPTGNFGDVFAGYAAQRMGLALEKLVIGSNSNDVLIRFLKTGTMTRSGVVATISPSMDIQTPSNFERLLFDMTGRDGGEVARLMNRFRQAGEYAPSEEVFAGVKQWFCGARLSDEETKAAIAETFERTGELLDPHSAIGVEAARRAEMDPSVPVVALATAHPAKFPAAVEDACARRPSPPPRLSGIFARKERIFRIANDVAAIERFVRDHVEVR